jgi:lysozyme
VTSRIDTHLARLTMRNYAWPIPWRDVEALGRSEDCRLAAYRCIAGKPSIAWGETEGVTMDMRWTPDQCDARFLQQVTRYARRVDAMCEEPCNDNQRGALVRLAYNIGLEALAKSTAMRKHNAADFKAAARAMLLWDKFTNPRTGQLEVSDALAARRAAESARYLEPVEGAPAERLPQAVAPEPSMTKSPTTLTGAGTVGGGVLVGISSLADQAGGVVDGLLGMGNRMAEFVGVSPQQGLALVLIAAGGLVLYRRFRQRSQGVA